MNSSFQNEIPRARINITLDVETDGAHKKKELPLKLLVLGDFSNGKNNTAVINRERINITKNNFSKVLAKLGPHLSYTVPNKIKNNDSELSISLTADSLQKFKPEAIVQNVPELRNLLAMRNLLKDFKSNLIDNESLRRELEKIVKDKTRLKLLSEELQANNPLIPVTGENSI